MSKALLVPECSSPIVPRLLEAKDIARSQALAPLVLLPKLKCIELSKTMMLRNVAQKGLEVPPNLQQPRLVLVVMMVTAYRSSSQIARLG